MLATKPGLNFPTLQIHWSGRNTTSIGTSGPVASTGQIGWSQFDVGTGMYLLGAENNDTDEYDRNVITKLWGQYLLASFGRDDGASAPHAAGDQLDLRVAFRDMHHLDAKFVGQRCPLFPRRRLTDLNTGVTGNIQQRLLEKVRDKTGIGAMRQHRGGAWRVVTIGLAHLKRRMPHRIVAARRRIDGSIHIPARPRLDAGIKIEGTTLAREPYKLDGGDIHRQVQQEVAAPQQRFQHHPVVVRLDRLDNMSDAKRFGTTKSGLIGSHDRDPLRCQAGLNRRRRNELPTTMTLEEAMANPDMVKVSGWIESS